MIGEFLSILKSGCYKLPNVHGLPLNAHGPHPTLGSFGPFHLCRHKSWVSLQGPPCAHDVAGTPHGEVLKPSTCLHFLKATSHYYFQITLLHMTCLRSLISSILDSHKCHCYFHLHRILLISFINSCFHLLLGCKLTFMQNSKHNILMYIYVSSPSTS